ncbi:protein of unknown function [Flavobacterium succinicans]|uniref:DUF4835 domain-containing protein n=1 Tax=Flavobacterium succinicans TaxID=29536 RepID=A0A1I4WT35_9FLAO|nr:MULTISPECIES: DUF4835 family protein [Flavobacterium]OOV25882.1 DUF4835 domain-containing protein [Flavobacterium sp. LM5]SFN16984.1 protein of unknown function [Flavobacterium succinicans]
MYRSLCFFFLVLFNASFLYAQQLNCSVVINAQKVTNTNQQLIKNLEIALNEFVNKTDWTGQELKQNEKIKCSMFITLSAVSSDQFSGTIQVQSSRLVFNSTYSSPIFNYNDKDFNFKYVEFENLVYNPNVFDSNLVSVLAYYSYIILGLNMDTFKSFGGNSYLETAQNILNVAQQGSYKGWSQSDGTQNRFFLINDLLSPTFAAYRQALIEYHQGLDGMSSDLKLSKEKVKTSILNLSKVHQTRPNAFLTRVFFDAKADEIASIFSGGPSITVSDLLETLNKISPMNATKWGQIKY